MRDALSVPFIVSWFERIDNFDAQHVLSTRNGFSILDGWLPGEKVSKKNPEKLYKHRNLQVKFYKRIFSMNVLLQDA